MLDRDGGVNQLHYLPPIFKIEGVHAWTEDEVIGVLLVTDADDESAAS